MLFELVSWWYGTGWTGTLHRVENRVEGVWRMFSVGILVRTLFAPWRRITTPAGKGIQQLFRSMIDNLVSRVVGFTVRIFVLIAAIIVTFLAVIFGIVAALAWPMLPLLAIAALVKGIIG
jgi:hypothetical protein